MATATELAIDEVRSVAAEPLPIQGQPTEGLHVEERQHEDTEIVWPTGPKLWVNMTCILVTQFLLGLDLTIVAVCIPSLTDQYKTIADIGWYSAAYAMTACCFNFFFGKLYTLFSCKKLLMVSIIIFEAGSLLCVTASTSPAFICGRAIAGIGNSGITAGCVLVIVHSFPNHKRPAINGLNGGIYTLAMVSAPPVGGALIKAWSWRLCFLINLPLGVVGIVSLWFTFQESTTRPEFSLSLREKAKLIDIWATLLLFAGISAFLLAVQWGGVKFSWQSPVVISLFITSILLLAGFVYLQHRVPDKAILPPKYLQDRTILAVAWFKFCTSGALFVVEQYFAIFFQTVKGYSASKAGIMGVPLIVGLALGASLGGVVVSKVGYYSLPMYITTLLSPIAAGFLSTADLGESNVRILAFLALLGFAVGFGSASTTSAIQTILKPTEVPFGLAVTGIGATMGGAISVCASATLFHNRLLHEVREQDPSVDAAWLKQVGLTDIRKVIPPDQLQKVLRGYDDAISQTLYMPVAFAVLTLVGSAATSWRSVKEKKG